MLLIHTAVDDFLLVLYNALWIIVLRFSSSYLDGTLLTAKRNFPQRRKQRKSIPTLHLWKTTLLYFLTGRKWKNNTEGHKINSRTLIKPLWSLLTPANQLWQSCIFYNISWVFSCRFFTGMINGSLRPKKKKNVF